MINDSLPTLRIVVLAAGWSVRLGEPKALARVRGVSLLQRTVRLLARLTRSSKMVVIIPAKSGRYRIGLDPRRVDFVANLQRGQGLSSSIRAGLKRCRYSTAVLLLPVDLAALQPREMARLIARWRGNRRKVVARRIGDQPGVPLILPRARYAEAMTVAGDLGLRDLVRRLPRDAVRLVNLPSAAADVDTPQDLERARRRLSRL